MSCRVILVGAGGGGRNTLGSLRRGVNVVAVADNDTRKHGTRFCGIPVIAVTEIPDRQFDLVLIASVFAPEIHVQLVGLGVPRDKIEIADERRLVNSVEFPWDAFAFLVASFVVLAGAIVGLLWGLF